MIAQPLNLELIQRLVGLTIEGAFAFEWPISRVAWIGSGNSLGEPLMRKLGQLISIQQNKFNPEDFDAAKVEVYKLLNWEGFDIDVLEGPREEAYINLWRAYKNKGYKIISKTPSIWKLVETVCRDPRPDALPGSFVVVLYYINQSGRRNLAAAFETVAEARNWIEIVLDGIRETLEPIQSKNNLTSSMKRWLRMGGE